MGTAAGERHGARRKLQALSSASARASKLKAADSYKFLSVAHSFQLTHGRGKPVSARCQGNACLRSDTMFDGKVKDWLSRAHRPRPSTSSTDSVDGHPGDDDGDFVFAAGGSGPSPRSLRKKIIQLSMCLT